MEKLLSALSVLATTAILTVGVAPSAEAAAVTTQVTPAAASDISISVQPTAVWGVKGDSGITRVSGRLGDTVVTDNRGGSVGWSVGATTSVFSNGTTTSTAVTYDSGLVTPTGVVTPVSRGVTTLSSTPAEVVEGTAVEGSNTATWNPTVVVTLPSNSTAGDYTGTITTSLI